MEGQAKRAPDIAIFMFVDAVFVLYSAAANKHRVRVSSASGFLNPLTPNDPYRGRTAPLTSKRGILYTGCAKIKKIIPAPKG